MPQYLTVSIVPDQHYYRLMAEIEALPLQKRAKWHGMLTSSDGVKHKTYYVDGELVFKNCSEWITVKPQSEQHLQDVKYMKPALEAAHERLNVAYQRGGHEAEVEEFKRLAHEAATGNHRSKPSKIRVPTGAGEPVRA
jgi:hypothetical protein